MFQRFTIIDETAGKSPPERFVPSFDENDATRDFYNDIDGGDRIEV